MAEIIPLRVPATLCIEPYRGVWRVALDGKFYGDFAQKHLAIVAAQEKTLALRLRGRSVTLRIASTEGGAAAEQFFEAL